MHEEHNNELINKFIEFKQINNRSKKEKLPETTIERYKKNLRYLYEHTHKKFEDTTEDDILSYLNKQRSVHTINNRTVVYKMFFKWLYNWEDHTPLPDCIKRIKTRPVHKDEVKYSQKVITEEEYEIIMKNVYKPIQKAFIECLWITGARMNEVTTLKSNNAFFDGKYTNIIIDESKTRTRKFKHKGRAENFLTWVETLQPFKDQTDKPLFSVYWRGRYKKVSYQYGEDILRTACKRANIRNITPHDFRHTKVTNMRKNGVPDTHIENLLGFKKDTQMFKTYDHSSIDDYTAWLENNETVEAKPTYELLEKQKKELQQKQQEEINKLKKELKTSVQDLYNIFSNIVDSMEDNDKFKEMLNEKLQRT